MKKPAKVTLTLTDLAPSGDGRSYVRLQLTSDPPLESDQPITADDLSLAQLMGRVAVSAVVDALEKHFKGEPIVIDHSKEQAN